MATIDPGTPGRKMGGTLALLLAAGLVSCSGGDEPGALPPGGGEARVTVSDPVTLATGEAYPATVAATREARIGTRTSGRIEEVAVDVGSRVRAGQVLAELDDGDVRARIDAAASAVRLARRTFERIDALAAEGAASTQELDEARTRLEAAEAELRVARAQADYTTLTAPFDAVVTARTADPGDLAAPGRSIVTLVGVRGRKVQADLPATLAGRVAEGDRALVRASGAGPEIPVRLSRVVPAVSPGARRFRVEAELPPDAGLLPGAWVRFALEGLGETSRWIPADAVVRSGQLMGVFAVETDAEGGDRLRLRWIRTGGERPGAVELLAGPVGPVVRRPAPTLRDGQGVDRVDREPWAGPGAGLSPGEPGSPVSASHGGGDR